MRIHHLITKIRHSIIKIPHLTMTQQMGAMTTLATELAMKLRRQAELLITLIILATELAIPHLKDDYFYPAYSSAFNR